MTSPLKKTPLHELHRKSGARMGTFGGWEMPIEYSGIVREHLAVRTRAGLFDVSHMGEIEIDGPGSLALVQQVACNDAGRLECGQIQYSALLTEQGTFVDDILVHRLEASRFLLCVNAGNTGKDYRHICRQNRFGARVTDVSDQYVQLAIQGPMAEPVLQSLVDLDLADIRYYRCRPGHIQGVSGLIARTGYTGEDGFEIYFPPTAAEAVWEGLSQSGISAENASGRSGSAQYPASGGRDGSLRTRDQRGYNALGGRIGVDGSHGQAGFHGKGCLGRPA